MDGLDIVALSVVFGLKNWFNNKKLSSLTEFIIWLLCLSLFKVILSYIKIPSSLGAIIFFGIFIWGTMNLLFKAYRKNKS